MEPDETRLLEAVKQGNRDACAEVVHAHYRSIYRFLVHLASDAAIAEDLTQETFRAAWEAIMNFRGRSSIGTWLHRIAYGKFIDAKRRMKRDAHASDKLRAGAGVSSSVPTPLEALAADEETRRVYAALAQLDDADRSVIALHYFEGMSYSDMAEVLAQPPGTLKWRTSSALSKLRAALNGRM